MDLNEEARKLYLRSSHGWRNAVPWDMLPEESKELYRDWVVRSRQHKEDVNE